MNELQLPNNLPNGV